LKFISIAQEKKQYSLTAGTKPPAMIGANTKTEGIP